MFIDATNSLGMLYRSCSSFPRLLFSCQSEIIFLAARKINAPTSCKILIRLYNVLHLMHESFLDFVRFALNEFLIQLDS